MIILTTWTAGTCRRHGGVVIVALGALALWQLPASPVRAQALSQLSDMLGTGKSTAGALGGMGGSLPSVAQASPSNIAGVLQFCVKNNFLSGGDAKAMGSSVLGKLSGSGKASDGNAFRAGSGGLLQTSDGQSFGLGGGIKEKVTEQACNLVLTHAQSLL